MNNTKIRPANYDAEFRRGSVAIYALYWESILVYIYTSCPGIVCGANSLECRGGEPELCGARVDDPLDIWASYTGEDFPIE
jgi:hypothetical protein